MDIHLLYLVDIQITKTVQNQKNEAQENANRQCILPNILSKLNNMVKSVRRKGDLPLQFRLLLGLIVVASVTNNYQE